MLAGHRQVNQHMPPAPLPQNESERYIALMAYRARGLVADVHAVQLVREAKAFFRAQQAVIALVGRTKVYFLAEVGAGFDSLPREHSFCTYAIHHQTPLVVEDTLLDPRFSDNPYVTGPPGLRFYAGAPLVDADGYCLGTFCLVDFAAPVPEAGGDSPSAGFFPASHASDRNAEDHVCASANLRRQGRWPGRGRSLADAVARIVSRVAAPGSCRQCRRPCRRGAAAWPG